MIPTSHNPTLNQFAGDKQVLAALLPVLMQELRYELPLANLIEILHELVKANTALDVSVLVKIVEHLKNRGTDEAEDDEADVEDDEDESDYDRSGNLVNLFMLLHKLTSEHASPKETK